jgi:hypothetical protein
MLGVQKNGVACGMACAVKPLDASRFKNGTTTHGFSVRAARWCSSQGNINVAWLDPSHTLKEYTATMYTHVSTREGKISSSYSNPVGMYALEMYQSSWKSSTAAGVGSNSHNRPWHESCTIWVIRLLRLIRLTNGIVASGFSDMADFVRGEASLGNCLEEFLPKPSGESTWSLEFTSKDISYCQPSGPILDLSCIDRTQGKYRTWTDAWAP